MQPTRVLLADDHGVMLAGVARALGGAPEFEIIGEASRGSQVLSLISETNPNVLLLDLEMPDLDGIGCLRRVAERYPRVCSIMLSACTDRDRIEEARVAGAAAFIIKRVSKLDLAGLITRAVRAKDFFVDGLDEAAPSGLSEREITILQSLALGHSNREISKELWLSEQTVKFHLGNVYRKLNVSNRTEAVRWACRIGLAPPFVGKAWQQQPTVALDYAGAAG